MLNRRACRAASLCLGLVVSGPALPESQTYVYDADGRLIGVEYGQGQAIDYPVNELGNRTSAAKYATTTSVFAFTVASKSVAENGSSVVLSVGRSGSTTDAASVTCSTANGTAVAGSDYTAASTVLSWPAGQSGIKSCSIPITNDTTAESSETFTVSLSNASGATIGSPASVTVTITDDDNPGTLAFSSSTATVGEADGSAVLSVTRTGGSTGAASITCSTSNGTATAGSDYTATSTTLNWIAGESGPKNCSVPLINNTTVESSETFTAALSAATGATLGSPSSTTVTIVDDDSSLAFSSSIAAVSEGAGSVSLSVNRIGNGSAAASVTCSTSNGTASAGSDYTSTSTVLNWGAGQSGIQTCSMPITDDSTAESSETFTAALSAASGATIVSPSSATVTITDNDSGGTLAFTSSTTSIAENAGSVSLTVSRTGGSTGAISVTCSTSNGTATAGSDYTATSTVLNWSAGQTGTQTCSVPITNDSTTESSETFTAALSGATGATIGSPSSTTVTITDNDGTGTLAFTTSTASVQEDEGGITLFVSRSGGTSGPASVTCSTSNGTATAGSDYTSTSMVLNWTNGQSGTQTCSIPVTYDTTAESNETFTATLSGASGAAIGSPSSTTVTIVDDDSTLAFTSSTASVSEGAGSVALSVTRTGSSSTAASVTCSTSNGTATAGSDYTSTSTGLNWGIGQTGTQTCSVPITDDSTTESSETFTAALSGASGATIGSPSSTTVTITDNDNNPGTLAFTSSTFSVAEGAGSVSLTVSRAGGSTGTASVTCATSNGTATAGSDYTATSTTLSWTAGQSGNKICTVPITSDSAVESNQTFTATLSGASGAALGSPSSTTVTIIDDDSTLAFSSSTMSVSEGVGSASLSVTRTGSSSTAASVTCATSNGTATAGSDYTATSATLNWGIGVTGVQTCSVPITNDSAVESSETFTAALSSAVGATTASPSSMTVTITDNDAAPGTLAFASSSYTKLEDNNGTAVNVSVVRSGGSSGVVSAQYTTSNGTAQAGQDYNYTSGTVTWQDGDTTNKTITITIVNDSAPESDEYFSVVLSNPTGGATLGSPSTTDISIPCNDGYSCRSPAP